MEYVFDGDSGPRSDAVGGKVPSSTFFDGDSGPRSDAVGDKVPSSTFFDADIGPRSDAVGGKVPSSTFLMEISDLEAMQQETRCRGVRFLIKISADTELTRIRYRSGGHPRTGAVEYVF